ncbi:TetR/AcrR family transcriptional regulator [Chitinophaga lutea]|uniref:TetR/AcrR family transcriptional regulator n=1 Tax=Chitinophaga lutea TaxID=2488634 RepID=A0A3N4PIL7_9BACT|nr:TetR/AcrR family transcriptional regulator [Chitinophaga lutea]RPE08523.1 TetR/AcrR family transcriptional regulator [Chitinophaga lutea]
MAGRNREFDEDKALESAAGVFWIKGYEGASTEDLLQAMALNKGSMYNAFGNKRELFLKVFQFVAARIVQDIQAVFGKHHNPLNAIEEIFYGVARSKDPEARNRGCFYSNVLTEMSGVDEELAKIAAQQFREVAAIYEKYIRQGTSDGFLPASLVPADTARYLINCWCGLHITRRMYTRKDLETIVTMHLKIFEKS